MASSRKTFSSSVPVGEGSGAVLYSEGSLKKGLFSDVPPSEVEILLSRATIRSLQVGAKLMSVNERSSALYIVLEGILEASLTSRFGKTVVLSRFSQGEIIGEIGALADLPRTADVTCVEACTVAQISISALHANLNSFPSFTAFVLKSLALRLAQSTEKLFDLATEDVPSRVLRVLRQLEPSDREQSSSKGFALLRQRPTHAELARLVGSSREVVGRALQLLEQAGEIEQDGKLVFIKKI